MISEKCILFKTKRFLALILSVSLLFSAPNIMVPVKVYANEMEQNQETNAVSEGDNSEINENIQSVFEETSASGGAISEVESPVEAEITSPQAFEGILPASVEEDKIVVTASLTTNAIPMSGDLFYLTYSLSAVANPSNPGEKIQGLKAEITIPKNLTVSDFVSTNDYNVLTATTNGDGSKTYKIVFKVEPTPGDNFAQVNIPIKFNAGDNPTIIEVGAENIFHPVFTIEGDNIDPTVVDTFNGTTTPAEIKPQNEGDWSISKTKYLPGVAGGDTYVNAPTNYRIQLRSPESRGVNLEAGAKVIEKIPVEAEYIQHDTPTGWTAVYDSAARTITWTSTAKQVVSSSGGYYSTMFNVWMKYPNATVGAGTVTNNVELKANYVRNGSPVNPTAASTHKVVVQPTPDGDFFEKRTSKVSVGVGDDVSFTLQHGTYNGYSNTATVYKKTGVVDGFKEITVVDDPLRNPTQDSDWAGQSDFYDYFDFTSLSIAGFMTKTYPERNNEQVTPQDIKIKLSFQTKKDATWHDYTAINNATSTEQKITKAQFLSTGIFDTDDNVSLIQIVYTYKDGTTTFPGDFIMPSITYNGKATKNGPGSTAQNSAYFYVKYADDTYNVNNGGLHGYEANFDSVKNYDSKMYEIKEAKPYISNYMNHGKAGAYIYQPGESVRLTIQGLDYSSTGTPTATGPFIHPEEYILIPANYKITNVSVTNGYGFNIDTPIDKVNDPDNTSLQVITYSDGLEYKVIKITSPNGQIPIGSYYNINVDVIVPENASNYADFHRVTMSMSHPYASDYNGNNQPSYITGADIYDLNQDGRTDTVTYRGTTKINVLRELLFTSQKYVGATQATYGQYATVPQGSDFFYKIEMVNTSPFSSADKVRAIDILPDIGDTGVYSKSGAPYLRGSEWAPTNYSLVSSSSGVTIYSTTTLPTADEIRKELQDVNSISTIPWTAGVLPGAKAIKIEKATATAPQAAITVELKAKAKTMAPIDPPLIAWNSFAYGSDYNNGFNSGIHMPVAEPPKVGVYVTPTPPLKLSGVLWNDKNKNGIQDTDENFLSGFKVSLFDKDNNYLGNTTTEANGAYTFLNLAGNLDYTVKIEKTKNSIYTVTERNVGTDTAVDSDFMEPSVNDEVQYLASKKVTLQAVDIIDLDAGLVTNNISGLIWYDTNKNGIREDLETHLSDIIVELYNEKGILVGSTTTDENGLYEFKQVTNQKYTLKIKKPLDVEYTLTKQDQGTDDTVDSDYKKGTDTEFAVVEINMQGRDITNLDAGLTRNGISGVLWYDYNRDGIQDLNEKRLSGMKVELYNQQQQKIGEMTTDETGAYSFDGLNNQDYTLKIVKPEGSNFTLTQVNVGQNADKDSDYTPDNTVLGIVSVTMADDDITHIDAGFVANIIEGVLWYDVNKDGIQETSESKIPGMTIELYDESGTKISETVTDEKGGYRFEGLGDQTYTLNIVPSDVFHYGITKREQGADTTLDSDYGSSTGAYFGTTQVVLNGNDAVHVDAGLITNDIQGVIWYDYNKDGIRNDFEPLVSGITIELYDENGILIATKNTDENGAYIFENVRNQTYEIRIITPTDTAFSLTKENQGEDCTLDSNFKKDATYYGVTTVVVNGEDIRYIDAGLTTRKTSVVVDLIDPNGKPISNGTFEVRIKNEDGTFTTVTTIKSDDKGRLISEPLPSGSYVLVQTSTDSDYFINEANTEPFVVTGDESGMVHKTVVNEPRNGMKIVVVDDNNKPMANVKITVIGDDGSEIEVVTNNKGEIYTDNLPPGNYTLRVNTPKGYTVKSNEIRVNIPENNTKLVEVLFKANEIKEEGKVIEGAGGGVYSAETAPQEKGQTPVVQENVQTPQNPTDETQPAKEVVQPNVPPTEATTPDDNVANHPSNESGTDAVLTESDRASGYNAVDMNTGGQKLAVDYGDQDFKLIPNVHYYEEFNDDMVPLGYHKVEHIDENGTPYWTIEPDMVALGVKENPKTGDNKADLIVMYQTMLGITSVALIVLYVERRKRTQ